VGQSSFLAFAAILRIKKMYWFTFSKDSAQRKRSPKSSLCLLFNSRVKLDRHSIPDVLASTAGAELTEALFEFEEGVDFLAFGNL
jgi:hypothetical protein